MRPAIRADNLSKQYRIGTRNRGAFPDLRETIADGVKGMWRRLRGGAQNGAGAAAATGGDFWALKDVSFDVKPGEVVGIIGRNGAGKSTLLKILSRIVEPTSGRAEVRGRIGSLLEVGTGFHPDLTGRENIYLNGSILGMSHSEIARKFDEIVAFSDIEQFLETPVKRYSSGMYVRLAFAVAAHLEPEILIVDEVLAVGDGMFQKKCLGKMEEVSHNGRTVLFVSHNMPSIKVLCTAAVLLKNGQIQKVGSVDEVTKAYLQDGIDPENAGFNQHRRIAHSGDCDITDAWLSIDGVRSESVEWEQSFEINLAITVHNRVRFSPEYLIRDFGQYPILLAPTGLSQGFQKRLEPGCYQVTSRCAGLCLAGGTYFIDVMAAESNVKVHDYYECALRFSVDDLPRPPHGWHFLQNRGQGSLPFAVESIITSI